MTREVAEVIAEDVNRPNPVVTMEDGQVWVSGMNARPWVLARKVASALKGEGFHVDPPHDDGAANHGGLIVPVRECEEISEETIQEVFGDA